MKKIKHGHHRVKKEAPEPLAGTSSAPKPDEEKELAYYIHDRVELMHQVFSVLRGREIRSMAPECVRNLSVGDLQELCLEELLGISSKRLCAILDGAEPPSDTSSSDSDIDKVECVSLDSISSVEELSSGGEPSKKKRKCKRKESKSKKTPREGKPKQGKVAVKSTQKPPNEADIPAEEGDTKAAERAGMTVLELLELQARARAIRAQLSLEQSKKAQNAGASSKELPVEALDSDDGVEIKEEPAEVVELFSSEDERKPDKTTLDNNIQHTSVTSNTRSTVTKKNDLTIIVPATQLHRKVKLNRNKQKPVPDKSCEVTNQEEKESQDKHKNDFPKETVTNAQESSVIRNISIQNKEKVTNQTVSAPKKKISQSKEKKNKFKKKVELKRKQSTGEGSDHDEITLQLSDTEKMDLLEGLDRKNYDNLTSSSDESSESSYEESESEDENGQETQNKHSIPEKSIELKNINNEKIVANIDETEKENNTITNTDVKVVEEKIENTKGLLHETGELINNKEVPMQKNESNINNDQLECSKETQKIPSGRDSNADLIQEKTEKVIEINNTQDIPTQDELQCEINKKECIIEDNSKSIMSIEMNSTCLSSNEISKDVAKQSNSNSLEKLPAVSMSVKETTEERENCEEIEVPCNKESDNNHAANALNKESTENRTDVKDTCDEISKNEMSEGELSDRESSEVEIFEKQDEIVCISDEETPKKKKKEKKKKEKKPKKEKKSKKKSDFREEADENFFNEHSPDDKCENSNKQYSNSKKAMSSPSIENDSDSEDLYEICEISDDSSCYEVQGTVLSKEPTSEEIAALSAKIDTEIEREEIITEEQIQILEHKERPKEEECIENLSWKDRWLDSKKVKKVLTTSNILNAMRKKNKELKRKLEESKKTEVEEEKPEVITDKPDVVEGSIEQFNTLQGSTKFVDPVKEAANENENGESDKLNVNSEMKRDAKQLLKMYKRLLKFNDEKTQDPNKVKKKKNKKQKKSKDKNKIGKT